MYWGTIVCNVSKIIILVGEVCICDYDARQTNTSDLQSRLRAALGGENAMQLFSTLNVKYMV